jgi:hypothetical protein
MNKNMKNLNILALVAAVGGVALQASAQVTAVNLGTGNPPATLGGYSMIPFNPAAVVGTSYLADIVNGNGTGSPGEWATWGQSYTGTVYVDFTGGTSLTLLLGGAAEAVDFYEEPNQFSNFDMTATDSSGATQTTLINGYYGSAGVGFYEDVAGGPYLTSITVTCTDPTGFAIGEFAINGGGTVDGSGPSAPDTASTLALMGLSALGLFAYNRFARVATV